MDKVTAAAEAVKRVKDGDILLIGGFLQSGSPETLIGALLENSTAKDLTIISNDTGTAATNTIKVMRQGRVKKVYAAYIGANPVTGSMFFNEPERVTLVPMGSLAEKIRAGGAGIKAFYTPTGVGTVAGEGKEKRLFDGDEYLLEMCITGDIALVKATIADKAGNLFMSGSTKNFNAIMPQAARYVIAEAGKIVESGEIDPELVTVPGIFVDAVVQSEA
jgi:acetate CoA/acetoacetate CoA-transferase alpha subunit